MGLVEENMALVPFLINKHFSGFPGLYDDLVQTGYEAMIMAENKFDKDRGFKFISFAKSYILGYCYTFLNRHSKAVSGTKTNRKNINRAREEYENSLYGEGIDMLDTVAEKYDVRKQDITDKYIVVEDMEEISDHGGVYEYETEEYIKKMVNELSDKERDVIRYYYGYDVPPVDTKTLAAMFNTDENEIERIRRSARKKLL